MPDINILAVAITTAIAFGLGAIYYMALGNQLAAVSDAAASSPQTPPWAVLAEVLRNLIVVTVVAGLAARAEVEGWRDGVLLGLVLWAGFPMVLWIGAMVHERTPFKLAAIHAGDWLLKLVVIAAVVAVWQ